MRIGLFGGTFDPIHFGHLRAAKEVMQGFHLRKIFLIPAAIPPHKQNQGIASAQDRLEMTRLAVADDPTIRVSDVELNRPGYSYTIDTVTYYQKQNKGRDEFYFIMGVRKISRRYRPGVDQKGCLTRPKFPRPIQLPGKPGSTR